MPIDREQWLAQVKEDALEPALPLIDTHHHLWDRPGRRYLPDEFRADLAGGHNFTATVYIEVETAYRKDGPGHLRPAGETEYVAGVAEDHARRFPDGTLLAAAIVPYADLSLGAAVEEVLDAHLAVARGRLRGIRGRFRLDANAGAYPSEFTQLELDDPKGREAARLLGRRGLSLDVFVMHPQLDALGEFAAAAPDTVMVCNHTGGPLGVGAYAGRRGEVFQEWKAALTRLARHPNLVLKLGGMGMPLTGLGWHRLPAPPTSAEMAEATRDWFRSAIDIFGPARCMFESNFPVDRLACSYTVLWNSFKRVTRDIAPGERDAVLRGTAARVYQIEGPA